MIVPRTVLALLCACAVAAVVVPGADAAAPVAAVGAPRHLRVLLTNDDGVDAPGIVAVRRALLAAGHGVTVVAPASNQSGTGGATTFVGTLQVTKKGPGVYAVAGTPADATKVGLGLVLADTPPDLVVSGTNSGQNVGAVVVHSGTVAAAVTALRLGVPAVAVSTETDLTTGETPFAQTAAFVVRLVDALAAKRSGAVLPRGLGLNVNYPAVPAGVTPGVVLTNTGRGWLESTYDGRLPTATGSTTTVSVGATLAPETARYADTTALAADQVSVTPIEPDYDLAPAASDAAAQLVRALTP